MKDRKIETTGVVIIGVFQGVTFISDIGIGYRVRPRVDIGYRHFPKFTYRSDTNIFILFLSSSFFFFFFFLA